MNNFIVPIGTSPLLFVVAFTPLRAAAACKELGVSTLLSDSLDDFVFFSGAPDADLPALLEEFEAQLNHYANDEWGYNPEVFPLLRTAARGFASGTLSRRALEEVSKRTLRWYLCEEGSEQELIDDLSSFIQAMWRTTTATARPEQRHGVLHSVPVLSDGAAEAEFPVRTATPPTSVVLTVVK